ncbi:hypothetical protein PG996_012728 [Apiospora saccharicola]|uniref:SMP domain-containing protein n=1 Tax=Apiospora saccharicola TaxID=335842 RepID=A0ABR1U3F0_9PEZI
MSPAKMDEKAAERIAKARGKNDPFAKRADMAARNNKDNTGGTSDASSRRGDSSNSQSKIKEEKK